MHYQILAVDDDRVNQKIIGLLLKALGLEYKIAANGREAVEIFIREAPDLVLMDIMMPDIDGYQAAQEIRRYEFGKGIMTPIIACTALDHNFVRDRCISAGINDYISKPISREVLKSKLETWLQHKLIVPIALDSTPLDKEVANRVRWANVLDDGPIDRKYLKLVYGMDQLDDIFALFLTVTEDLLLDLRNAIKKQDSNASNSLAHELKASSYSVGAREMATRCVDLEKASITENWMDMQRCLLRIQDAFEDLQSFVHRTREVPVALRQR